MRHNLDSVIGQPEYEHLRGMTTDWATKFKAALDNNEKVKLAEFMDEKGQMAEAFYPELGHKANKEVSIRKNLAKRLLTDQFDYMAKAGVTTGLGINFYDLRAPVALLYPVNTPFRNTMPRHGRVNAGYGLQPRWMATRNPGVGYAGASEGNRVAFSTPDNNQYTAPYKGLGVERDVTFEAQWAGEGFADNLADERIRGMHSVMLQEEAAILLGNSGISGTGFKLGTAPTPTSALNTAASNFTGTTYISGAVVFLTAMGYPTTAQYGYTAALSGAPTVTTGLTPQFSRVNADGSKDLINGGMSAISGMSTVRTCDSTHTCTLSLTPAQVPNGVFAYAWFVDATDSGTGLLSNAYLYAITTVPSVVVNGLPTGTQTGTAQYLNQDNSYQNLDYDGLLTYTASTPGAYWKNVNGSLTSQKNGRVTEIENALLYVYQNFQASVDGIWGSPDAIENLSAAIRWNGTNSGGYYFTYTRDSQNNLLGGFVCSGYQSQYNTANPKGGTVIPLMIHPMMPAGTLFLDVSYNPYPDSRIPFVRGLDVRRDMYAIDWPVTSRQWTSGIYLDEVLAHYVPWISCILTGITTFVGS